MSSQVNITLEDGGPLTAIVSFGSNLAYGKRSVADVLGVAIETLRAFSLAPVLVSSFYQTEPLGCTPGTPDFINGIIILKPLEHLSAVAFLEELHRIERRFGRKQSGDRGKISSQASATSLHRARSLDLDLICWGKLRSDSGSLVLPHPRAHLRRFVLAPLAELVPGLILPGQTLTVQALLSGLDCVGAVSRLKSF
ncbi:MAG TPA: 2-amino-4-hydroxy-6-hydroxymethyldihydropteridine diphosphokinase [Gammaproteobacteria bacterium]|jgi:2-amino-4-hydroxy-6-hydroxymethyldihydropteridine diphosphokinase|nr:2-amino-4-hydroxy-6-hydroxymethyldihydropteridine diphosphokinase [Gammaproteobacteria bacterium]HIF88045.1 2-amino-4-hydroxy-6-hydroxymethyldihydropteridine diphosphokinase [Gammaproteobacteria bacterium]HIL63505.1 2-amino-4-hydroxy-6-hydroxymethyldihydropteridine diphosphokinase [Porticoccaceae bacterium]HIN89588.1 2-amino-4-hydroxy-6-hydroxymethyldihydropteridine diphosphokinase [Porticoccaceae bacterium]